MSPAAIVLALAAVIIGFRIADKTPKFGVLCMMVGSLSFADNAPHSGVLSVAQPIIGVALALLAPVYFTAFHTLLPGDAPKRASGA